MPSSSAIWLRFLQNCLSVDDRSIRFTFQECPAGFTHLVIKPAPAQVPGEPEVEFAVGKLDETGVCQNIHSGEPSPPITALDERLKQARLEYPSQPLLVWAAPETPWPRGHSWMLGEYLAERDLPLWVDLSGLERERAREWVSNLYQTGLACDRTAVQVSSGVTPDDLTPLTGLGVWVVSTEGSPADGMGEMNQL